MRGRALGLRLSGRRAAVLGRPIEHSLSPVLHRAAYTALGLDWDYAAIDCGVAELAAILAERTDWAGFSCTMPLKHALLDLAAEVRPRAQAVDAANTLLPGAAGWVAENTDVGGIVAALNECDVQPGTATILGAGGTAQAAVVALASIGLERCAVLVRDPSRADRLLATAERAGLAVEVGQMAASASALAAGLVISTLPAGAADPLVGGAWRPGQTVLDVVYADWPTRLATGATAAGAQVVSGAVMLLHQAAEQVELMTGCLAPVEAMRAALRAAVPGCGV